MFRQLPSILSRKAAPASSSAAMSTANSSGPAPWRAALLNDIDKMSQATFTLSTLHYGEDGTAAATPRARTCIFRGLWGELPENSKNKADRNPPLFASDLLTFTTDRRMHKTPDLLSSDGGNGGGPVEACFWVTESQAQWRVRGRTWVFGKDADDRAGSTDAARQAVRERMRVRGSQGDEEDESSWSWSREVKAHFGNLSPMMRGTFRNPPPGTPRAVPGGPGEELGQRVDGIDDEMALGNFRVCVIVPDEVELVDLSDAADPRRWLYTYVGGRRGAGRESRPGAEVSGEWEKVELWP